ncbi:MAG: hypothetical protein GXO91_00725 [FCB group bacterium]|nr:hypothetical protein [FCB group bacterium]
MNPFNNFAKTCLTSALCYLIFVTGCEPLEFNKPQNSGNDPVIMITNPDTFNRDAVEIDWIQINSRSIVADTLRLNVSYEGGCRSHSMRMYATEPIWVMNSYQCALYLSHDDKGDPCTDLITENIGFDISLIHENVQLRIFQYGADEPMYPLLEYNGGP